MNATWLDSLVTPWTRRRVTNGPAARTRPDIRYLHLPQASIRHRIAGRGEHTVVFCTDPPVVLELYDELIRELEKDFRVVVFEPPAFGVSLPRAGLDFSMPGTVAIVREFLLHLGESSCVLAFPCVPAYSALWLAAHEPQLVKALVLMQAPDWHEELRWKNRRDPKNILGRPYLGQLMMRLLGRKRARDWYRFVLGRRELLEPFTAETQRAFDHGGCFSLASAFQKFLSGAEPAFGLIRQPALVIWGGMDRSHAGTDRESIRRYLPQARIVHFAESGHFPELEAPQRFAAELRALLQ